ncbi:MAG: helix-turn-helix transcriptional regulator [Hyphomicrobiaceae bacterium]
MARDARLTAEENARLSDRIREEIARRRMSRDRLAAEARVSLSTLEKALSGRRPFTLATIVRLEEALGVNLPRRNGRGDAQGRDARSDGNAPDELGSYNRAAVAWLEGTYLTLRPSFGDSGAIYAYRTDIAWAATGDRLSFRETERTDREFAQFGDVAVPHQSGHIYLLTNRHGQIRLVVVARPVITGEMHGVLTTLKSGRGSHLSPVATPIVLKPLRDVAAPAFGRIDPRHQSFGDYRRLLDRTCEGGFAEFLTGGR